LSGAPTWLWLAATKYVPAQGWCFLPLVGGPKKAKGWGLSIPSTNQKSDVLSVQYALGYWSR